VRPRLFEVLKMLMVFVGVVSRMVVILQQHL
jgi:hypothetical protein